MARPFVIEIAESEAFLEKSVKQAKTGLRKERLQMLWWIKTRQIRYRQEIGERLGRSPATISRWLSLYRQGGLAALLEEKKAPGAVPQIRGEVLDKLKQRLDAEEGFRRYGAIVDWLEQECGITLHYKTVRQFVRNKLQAQLKVPRPRSLKQFPEAMPTFKNKKTSVSP
jgi:transposase